ncbi:Serine/threonine-protein phosphatase 7 long form-like [Vitis vinifera]|uniref:Serine/threonine-protein phosphatase 7 long form-like n=1 Tax=Vitis vinifera TaxID=29760 RepID=A0A438IRZ9_VITVI|nr:Serine/threonine-protein phosphatase 7 long form-like [Vitis vinifera]
MIYDIIGVDRDDQLVLKCRHPTEMNKFQPLVVRNDRTVARMLLVPSKYGMSSVQLFIEQTPNHYHLSNEMGHLTRLSTGDTDVDDENERDEEDDRDDAINTDEIHLPNDDENCCQIENIDLVMVQEVVECENTRFVNLEVGDRFNNPEVEFEVENTSLVASPHGTQFNISNDNLQETFVPISYHMPPTPQFLNMDAAINCVVSDWTPWKKPTLGNVDGELSIGQIFSSKSYLQHAVKMFSIKAHQEFTVYRSNANVLVLQCKKAPHANATKGNDSERYGFVSKYIETLVKAEMTVTIGAIQAVVAEQFGYQISYQKAMKAKRKAMTRLFGDWYKSYAELPRFFLALEQSNPGCIMYSKTVPGNNPNEEIFQRVFWAFAPSITGFAHCRPVLSIDGTHLYGKYKGTLLIAMDVMVITNCFHLHLPLQKERIQIVGVGFLACIRVGVTQRKGLCLISDRHPSIIAAVNETYSGWTQPDACHRFCMRHLASNFNTKFKDKTLKDLMCRAAMESKGARTLPITALVQLTFYWVNSYFTVRREHGASRLASGEEFTPHIDAKIKAKVVKAGAHEVLLYDHVAGRFHVKTRHSVGSSNRKPRTYHVTLQTGSCTCNKTLLLGFPCSHILVACHCRAIDFRQFVQGYYTTRAYLSTWAPLFYPIFDELEWPQYNGPIIVPSDSMKRLTSGRPTSSRLHNEMDARETRTPQTCGLCKQSGHNRRSCPNRETNDRRNMDTPLFRARPDPEDTSVLTLQHRHRSSTIRVDPDMGSVLSCRHRMLREWVLDDRVRPYIIQSGFYVFHRVGHVKVDWPLITALVERWRPETHTFHMPVGEMTITLQDVAILFGLRVHGHPVTGSTDIDWHALCEELLGVRPAETDIRGASLTVRFITTHFSRLPPGVIDEVTLQRHARAYLLLLVSGSLFTDKKGVYIQLAILPMLRDFGETAQYSWGSATLAHLYRELCRASLDSAESIAGPLHLLQLWSWERLHVGRPSRSLPHAPVPIDERFPPDALGSRWRVPLSHTDTPHHVLVTYRDEFDRQRSDQFGLIQGIPSTPPIDSDLHSIDRRGRPQFDWRLYHEHYVALWEVRGDHIVTAAPIGPHMDYHAPYMTWYRRITRRFITPMSDFGPMRYQATALSAHLLIETMTSIISRGGHALEDSDTDACRTGIVDIIRMATDVMCIIREDYRLPHVEHGGDRSPAQSTVARPPLVRGRSTSRGRGRYSSCHPITSSVSASLQPPTFLSSRLVQSPISSDVPLVQHPTSSDPPSAQPLTSSDPPSVQPPTSLDLPPSQPPTSSDPPLVQIDTSTQLDLPPVIPRVGGTYVDLDCYLLHHLYFQL